VVGSQLQAYHAWWQHGAPVYAPKRCRVRHGMSSRAAMHAQAKALGALRVAACCWLDCVHFAVRRQRPSFELAVCLFVCLFLCSAGFLSDGNTFEALSSSECPSHSVPAMACRRVPCRVVVTRSVCGRLNARLRYEPQRSMVHIR
jgi:hypothetical protein